MSRNDLHILWTNDNPITSELMVLMYAQAAATHHWWDSVTVIIWGATAKLVADNSDIQARVASAQQAGVAFSACQACANALGTADALRSQGIEVKLWGSPLTEIIKQNAPLITV